MGPSCIHVAAAAAAAILKSRWDVYTGRSCPAKKHRYWRTASVTSVRRSPAKESVFGSLQYLVAGNEGPGWIG